MYIYIYIYVWKETIVRPWDVQVSDSTGSVVLHPVCIANVLRALLDGFMY